MNDPTAGAPGWFAGVLPFADACESCVGLKLGIAGPRWFPALRLPKMVRRSDETWTDDDPKA
jgi:hypothetical protein